MKTEMSAALLLLLAATAPIAAQAQGAGTDQARQGAPALQSSADPSANAAPDTGTSATITDVDAGEILPTLPVPQTPDSVPVSADAQPGAKIEEIIVTATKREQSLREIPASIAVLKGDELERSGAAGIDDIARRVPGLNVATENGVQRVTIRGISAANNTNATTGTLFGNVSFTDAYLPVVSLDPQPFDLKTVEVLKGPQGTLFGAGALNGAVRYVPEPAMLGMFSAKYFAQYENVEHGADGVTYGAAVNLPIGDTLAVRIVGFDRASPGWIDNLSAGIDDANRTRQKGLRTMVEWQPDELWNVSLIYGLQDTSIRDEPLTDNLDGELTTRDRPRTSPTDKSYRLAGVNIERTFDWARLVSETDWVGKDSHTFLGNTRTLLPSSPVGLLGVQGGGNSDTWSQELRLVSPDDTDSRWRWIGGVFGSRQKIDNVVDLFAGNADIIPPGLFELLDAVLPPLDSLVDGDGVHLINLNPKVKVEELALFGSVTRELGDSWELTLGGRLYKTRSFGTNLQRGLVFAALNGSLEYTDKGGIKDTGFNPQASLSWHITDDILSYVAVSKGFRVGGLQPGITLPTSSTQAPHTFKSDTIWNYEGGVRTQWFDRTLSVDLTGFYIDWKNPQLQQHDSTLNIVYLDNVGGVESKGADFALQWITPFRLQLSANASYAKTVTTKAFQSGSGEVSMPGDDWPYAPRWQTSTTLSLPLEIGNWLLSSSVTHSYIGKTVNDIAEQMPIFNYQQLDAQLDLLSRSWTWFPEITLTVNNIMDKRAVVTSVSQGLITPVSRDVAYIQPRTFILRFGGSF
ncbi:TonB-dependent receptor [Solimonas terrae]|uniref:TonB-dependent receptor n=1 Tax=Solimonas terrae TaxID=1396819 RepID=A0A6M2BLW2_9GAMM|nr:TonB-dependent receptor [Solimonas terrae]NGY03261.1 TonB-dependent receptor [Solimonas terrae]